LNKFFDENKAGEGHGRKSLRGGVFSMASRGINIFVQLGSTFVLMRYFLTPDDVGLVGMVTVFTGLAPVLIDLGTRDAAVQKPKITHEEVSALFWLTMGIGAALALLLVVCGPLIVAHNKGEARLQNIALVSAITFLLSAASCQHTALLRRAMMFQEIAMIEVGANVVGSIGAIVIAFAGLGYWALVLKPIIGALFTLVAVCCYCRWTPGIPRLTEGVREMLRFGINVTGFTLTDYVGRSADRFAIGGKGGTSELGYYNQAFFVYDNTLGLLAISLHSVAVASLSKLRDNLTELKRSWAKALSTLAFYAMPAFALLAVTAQDFIVVLLTEKWLYTGVIVSVLALRGIPHVVERTLGWLHVPAGRSDRWMRWGVMGSIAQLIALFCGLPFGTMGVAVAYTVSMYFLFVPAIAYAGKPLGIGAKDVIRTVGPQLIGALACALFGFELLYAVLGELHPLLRLPILIAAIPAFYLVIVVGLFKINQPLNVVRNLVRDMAPRALARMPGLKLAGAIRKD
jgi:PST family polysaccharide transporter